MAKRNKKKIIIIVSILLIAVILLLIILKKTNVISSKNEQLVATEKAVRRTIVEKVTASGKIQPETEIKLSPDVSGEIVELYVREGDVVKKGDILLKIKPDLYESALERSIASGNSASANYNSNLARLEQIRAQFIQTEANYNRDKALYEKGVISQSEFESSEAAYKMGKADIKSAEASANAANFSIISAQASIREAQENLQKTSIFAPSDGTISQLNVEKGERVVGTEMMAGTEMMRIANLDVMEVIVDVSENSIIKVKLNDSADIEVDAYLNRKFKGIVTEIANSANNSSATTLDQVTNFKVKVRLLLSSYQDLIDEGNKHPFRPGMSATVDIHTKSIKDVVSVPIQSVAARNMKIDSNSTESPLTEVVFKYNNGTVEQQKVKIGIQDANYIQILEGINENDEIVSAPYNMISKILYDGMKVKKTEKELLFNKNN